MVATSFLLSDDFCNEKWSNKLFFYSIMISIYFQGGGRGKKLKLSVIVLFRHNLRTYLKAFVNPRAEFTSRARYLTSKDSLFTIFHYCSWLRFGRRLTYSSYMTFAGVACLLALAVPSSKGMTMLLNTVTPADWNPRTQSKGDHRAGALTPPPPPHHSVAFQLVSLTLHRHIVMLLSGQG